LKLAGANHMFRVFDARSVHMAIEPNPAELGDLDLDITSPEMTETK